MRAAILPRTLPPARDTDETIPTVVALSNAQQCTSSPREAMRSGARGRLAAVAAATLLVLLGGCARDDDSALPAACGTSPGAIVDALSVAPEPVRLDGTALSACFEDSSDGGEVQQVGAIYLAAAAQLSEAASTDPGGPEAVQLAYLIGAVQRGASGSQGVHYELARRLEDELSGLGRPAPAVRDALRAGREGG